MSDEVEAAAQAALRVWQEARPFRSWDEPGPDPDSSFGHGFLQGAEWMREKLEAGPDTSKSFLPGSQWGLNFSRRVGQSAELDASVKRAVEKHLNVFVQAIENEFGIDGAVIPRPSWETTGLVGSVEDIKAVVGELESADGWGGYGERERDDRDTYGGETDALE